MSITTINAQGNDATVEGLGVKMSETRDAAITAAKRVNQWAWEKYLDESPDASRVDFDSGWDEALDHAAEREAALVDALEHYADENNWLQTGGDNGINDWYDNGDRHGYECAQQALAKQGE